MNNRIKISITTKITYGIIHIEPAKRSLNSIIKMIKPSKVIKIMRFNKYNFIIYRNPLHRLGNIQHSKERAKFLVALGELGTESIIKRTFKK